MRLINIIIILCISLLILSCVTDDSGDDRPWYNYMGIMDADGTNIHYISNETMENYMNGEAQFTPDGTKLTNGRYIMNLDGTGFKQLVPDSLLISSYCCDQLNNMYLILPSKTRLNHNYLCNIDLYSNNIHIISDTIQFNMGSLAVSNDNTLLYLPSYTGFKIYNLINDSLMILNNNEWATYAIFANNDTDLYFINPFSGEVKSINLMTSETKFMAPRGFLANRNQISTKFVYKVGDNCELLELNNGTYNYSFINNIVIWHEPSITNLGDKVVYAGYEGIIVNDLNGKGEQIIKNRGYYPKISPTGDKIIFFENLQLGHVTIGKNQETR